MLPTYAPGSNVVVNFTLPQHDGATIAPTGVEYEVTDENDVVVQSRISLVGYTSGNPKIEVPASKNALTSGDMSLRIVTIFMTTASDGVFTARDRYVIQTASILRVRENSFQTLDQALITRHMLPKLVGWDVSDDQTRTAALVEAHVALCKMRYRYRSENVIQSSLGYDEYDRNNIYTYVYDMANISQDDWGELPVSFVAALRKAQMVEADSRIGGDPDRDRRLAGVLSETVGESKVFFNARPPLQLPICRPALDILSGYFYYRYRIERT